ncbi:TetR/AcrR family transcriptional regulator [Kribbella qitaiheensis]|uniref:TetR/AcrR family transcriptional regulator n=1 Tax=Kribbella qitaiheensis TaxID=1544730 RepID=A0A7G6WV89_9ACTN|nr:TetR/AcrR family transcriptional regulator [Kribbella qitaiheensis]QNE17904.1 TetR/AcrR family transcriptional regulator [Kribbella qitaiheensis]
MSEEKTGPRSRRERPAKAALTRAGIVATAVELVLAEGLARVTMRRLAQELDTGAASLYVYVRNTDELHAAVLEELLGAVDLAPATAAGDWRDRLERVLTSYADVLFEYPGLAQSALVARPSGPLYLNLVEALLALLDEGGVPKAQAAWGIDLLLLFATATAAEHAASDPRAKADDGRQSEQWAALATAVRNLSAETHPQIAAHGDDLLSGPGEARLAWGFRVLINGVLGTPKPEGESK